MAAAVFRSALPDILGVATDSNSSPSSSSVSAGTRPRRVRVAARRMVPATAAVLMEEEQDTSSRASTSGAGPGGGGFSTGTRDARGRFHMLLEEPAMASLASASLEQPTTTAAMAMATAPSQLDQVDRPEPEPELQELETEDSSELELETDSLWLQMRAEARADSAAEPALVSYLYSTVLAHRSLERALAFHLGNKLSSSTLLSTQLFSLILDTLTADAGIRAAVRADLRAVKARDPACVSYAHAMLNFKGFQACQAYRVAHALWLQGRASLALALQSRVSEVFHVDIHPAARIGKGVLFDHATGVVVGETACVGDHVSILHHVTLGGTGAAGGARHPRIGDGVLIGAGATILGNVRVGECAKIGAGSVVLIDVPARATAVGNPARVVAAKPAQQQGGRLGEAPAPPSRPSETMDHASVATAWSDYVI